jgi:hypothetical protein
MLSTTFWMKDYEAMTEHWTLGDNGPDRRSEDSPKGDSRSRYPTVAITISDLRSHDVIAARPRLPSPKSDLRPILDSRN